MVTIGRRAHCRLVRSLAAASQINGSAANQDSTEGDLNLSAARSTNWVLVRPRSNSTYGPGDTYLPTTYLGTGRQQASRAFFDQLSLLHDIERGCTGFPSPNEPIEKQTGQRRPPAHPPQPLRNITTEHSSFLSCSDFPFSLVATSDLLLFLPCDRRTGHFCRSSSREQEGDQTPGQHRDSTGIHWGIANPRDEAFLHPPSASFELVRLFGNQTSEQDDRPPVHSPTLLHLAIRFAKLHIYFSPNIRQHNLSLRQEDPSRLDSRHTTRWLQGNYNKKSTSASKRSLRACPNSMRFMRR